MSDSSTENTPPSETLAPAFETAYPAGLRTREHGLLESRRQNAGLPLPQSESQDGLVGFGLSGGGIRSATFALGLFQSLARKGGLLRQIDYVSTVSGGGYFGSFFGRLLTRDYVKTADDVDQVLAGDKEPEVLDFLRENGRYMSPNGAGDSLLFGAVILRNWVSVQLVLALFGLAMFLGLQLLRSLSEKYLGFPPAQAEGMIWWSPLIYLPLIAFIFVAFPLGWAYWLVGSESDALKEGAGDDDANAVEEASAIPPVAALALVFFVSLWLLVLAVLRHDPGKSVLWGALAAVALLAFAAWKIAASQLPGKRRMDTMTEKPGEKGKKEYRKEKMDQALYRNRGIRNRLGLWLTTALCVTALLLALALVDSLGQSLYAVLKGGNNLKTWLAPLFSALGGLAAFGRWIALFFSNRSKDERPSTPLNLVATVAALLLLFLLLMSLNLASHAIAWRGGTPKGAPETLLQTAAAERLYNVEVRTGAAPVGMDLKIRERQKDAGNEEKKPDPPEERDPLLALVAFASTLLLSILFGQTWPFVNRSTHQPIYGARLTRAYLGASNKKRRNGTNVTETVEGDDIDLARYWPPPEGNAAPLHLINVTINETIDGQTQIQQQDRKGTGLALGPCGLSAGVRHHVVLRLGDDPEMMNPTCKPIDKVYPESGFRVFDYQHRDPKGNTLFTGEMLPLGTWVSISGAAFSTGIGARTSLGLSILTGFGNVRLGRWWDSGVVRDAKGKNVVDETGKAKRKISLRIEDALARLFPVQTYMLDEMLARFPGTSRRHWYLSDGGHFENMGGYELIRRRLPFIVIVDAEQDDEYSFGGLANLVRKARIDFGAEIYFQTEEALDKLLDDGVRPYIGALEQLRRGIWEETDDAPRKPHGRLKEPNKTGRSLAHAALARVKYRTGEPAESWLLYVKPTLTGREPVDLLEYHRAHPAFPHEPTLDQYFDEAQWESYRRLGQYIGDVLFGGIDQLLPDASPGAGSNLLKRRAEFLPEMAAEESIAGPPSPPPVPSYS